MFIKDRSETEPHFIYQNTYLLDTQWKPLDVEGKPSDPSEIKENDCIYLVIDPGKFVTSTPCMEEPYPNKPFVVPYLIEWVHENEDSYGLDLRQGSSEVVHVEISKQKNDRNEHQWNIYAYIPWDEEGHEQYEREIAEERKRLNKITACEPQPVQGMFDF